MARIKQNGSPKKAANTTAKVQISDDLLSRLSEEFPEGYVLIPLAGDMVEGSETKVPGVHYLNCEASLAGFGVDTEGTFSVFKGGSVYGKVTMTTADPVLIDPAEKPKATRRGRKSA